MLTPSSLFPNLFIVQHPLVQHKLSLMRSVDTPTHVFRELLKEISLLMGYEITRSFPLTSTTITTPLCSIPNAPVLDGKKAVIVPILRAGIGMSDGLSSLMPSARIGHIGLYRDHVSQRPVEYLVKLPNLDGRMIILCDPMLATGYSLSYAIDILKKRGVAGSSIQVLCLVVAPEGASVVSKTHPDVAIFTAALDEKLNEHAYIVPGLGDAGDRLFGTK